MTQAIFDRVKLILVERFVIDAQKIHPESALEKELGMDSLDAIDLLIAVNETFGIRISETALSDIHTVGELVAAIEKFKPRK